MWLVAARGAAYGGTVVSFAGGGSVKSSWEGCDEVACSADAFVGDPTSSVAAAANSAFTAGLDFDRHFLFFDAGWFSWISLA